MADRVILTAPVRLDADTVAGPGAAVTLDPARAARLIERGRAGPEPAPMHRAEFSTGRPAVPVEGAPDARD